MEYNGEDNIDNLDTKEKNTPTEYKDNILDENFRKAMHSMKKKKESKFKKRKKPFLRTGIVLFIVSIICLGIILKIPWMYIKYDLSSSNMNQSENFYYIDFYSEEHSNNQTVETFFISENSTNFLGVNSYDFRVVPKLSIYVFSVIALLGIVFTILVYIDNKKDFFSNEKLYVLHTFFMILSVIMFTLLIYLSLKFFGAAFLSILNINILKSLFPGLIVLFPAPLCIIFISAGIMKICGTLIKSNFREIIKIKEEKDKNKFYINRRA